MAHSLSQDASALADSHPEPDREATSWHAAGHMVHVQAAKQMKVHDTLIQEALQMDQAKTSQALAQTC